MQSIEQEIRKFVVETFLYGNGHSKLQDTDSFLDRGLIDSTGMLELVNFIQQQHGIKVEDEELIPDNLDSIEKLGAFIRRKVAIAA